MEQQFKKIPSDNSLIETYSELPSQNLELQALYFELNKQVLNMVNDLEETFLVKIDKLEALIGIVQDDYKTNTFENSQPNNVITIGNKLEFNESNSSYSTKITTIPLGSEYPNTFISNIVERGDLVMEDISAYEMIKTIITKLDDLRRETKEDMTNLKNELKTDINKADVKLENISNNTATMSIVLAKIEAVNSKESIDERIKSAKKHTTKITFISIVIVSVVVLIVDKLCIWLL